MSLFTNLLNLYSSGNKPVEDFFTEIIAYYFSINNEILLDWLKQYSIPGKGLAILNPYNSRINISTQVEYKKLEHQESNSRIDIVIELVNDLTTDLIFIECKIGSGEIYGQLKRYAEILNEQQASSKYLLYITRNYDSKEEVKEFVTALSNNVKFIQLRWYHLYDFLLEKSTDIFGKEILLFMEKNKMNQPNQFSSLDVLTLMNFSNTFTIMDSSLGEEVQDKFKNNFGTVQEEKNNIKQCQTLHRYIICRYFNEMGLFYGLGYWNLKYSNLTQYPVLGIVLGVKPKHNKTVENYNSIKKIMNNYPDKWFPFELGGYPYWQAIIYKNSLQSFLSIENQLDAIKEFFLESIDELINLQPYFDFSLKGVSIEDSPEEY